MFRFLKRRGFLQILTFSLFVALPLLFIILPSNLEAQPNDFSIQLKPKSARANMRSRLRNRRGIEERLERGVAGTAVQSALKSIKSRGQDPSPVPKSGATVPAKIKAEESGNPGLSKPGEIPTSKPRPNPLPNFSTPPPAPQSPLPQICQQILGLIQQLSQQQQGSGGNSQQQSANSSNCGPTG